MNAKQFKQMISGPVAPDREIEKKLRAINCELLNALIEAECALDMVARAMPFPTAEGVRTRARAAIANATKEAL